MNSTITSALIFICILGAAKISTAQSCYGNLGGPSLACVGGSHSYFLYGGTANGGTFTNSDVSGVQGVNRTVSGSTITWLQAGNYTINFQTQCGVVPKLITVSGPTAVGGTASISPAGTICPGQAGVTVSVSGFSSSVTNWEKRYSGGNWTSLGYAGSTLPSQYVDVAVEADYRAYVQGTCGATAYSSIAHVSFTTFNTSIFLTGGGTYCSGTYVTLSLSGTTESGVTYQLKRPDGSFGTSYAGPGAISWYNETQSGTYTVIATKNGCSTTITSGALVTITPNPQVYTLSGNTQICSGASTVLSINGSQTGTTYTLKRIDNGYNITMDTKSGTGNSIAFNPVSIAGTFHVVATKSSCTSVTNSVSTTLISSPAAPAFGETRQFCGFAKVAKATNDPSWYWLPNATTFEETNNAQEITVSSNTTVYLGAKGSGGCWTVVSQAVNVSNALPSVAVTSSQTSICSGGSVTFTASGTDFYIWHDNVGNVMAESPTFTTQQLTTTTSFIVTGYDSRGCYRDVSTTITVWPEETLIPNIPIVTKPSGAYALNINNTNNVPADFSYFWQSTPDGTSTATFANPRTSVPPGIYYVRARNVKGCWGPSISVEVPDLTLPAYTTTINNSTVNYVRKYLFKQKNLAVMDPDLYNENQADISTQYIDGIGRPMQMVSKKASPTLTDMVEPVDYDAFGRENRKFLPYVASTSSGDVQAQPFTAQKTFYQVADKVAHSDLALSYTDFEDAPLNRPKFQFAPGESWVGTAGLNTAIGIKTEYGVNLSSDQVKRFDVGTSGIVSVGTYAEAALTKTKTFDEHGNDVISFTNKNGQTLLKRVKASATEWAETYYVYDDFGNLSYVLPPELTKYILGQPQPYTPTQTILDNLAFQYKYDGRNRMIEKKVPGAASVYIVYDTRDRIVLMQDGNQRTDTGGGITKREWTFTKYDVLNRPIITGIYTHGTVVTQATMQSHVNTQIATYVSGGITMYDKFYEDYNGTVATEGYTNRMFPTSGTSLLTVTYYDNYAFRSMWTGTYTYVNDGLSQVVSGVSYSQPTTANANVIGLVTGAKVKVLDGGSVWLKTISYFDDKYRLIQTQSDNYRGGKDRVSNLVDFTGKILATKTVHATSIPTSRSITRRFVYDHMGRLIETWHRTDAQPEIRIAYNKYNELGQLVDKKLHSLLSEASDAKQSIDYRYNIRGWVTSINDAALTLDGAEPKDYFGMELGYNLPFAGINDQPTDKLNFNGNISAIKWSNNQGVGTTKENAYSYKYDPLNRLSGAVFKENASSWGTPANNAYAETGFAYDLNGNIKSLQRNDKRTSGWMDNLVYDYGSGTAASNKLLGVRDDGDDFSGFIDGSNSGADYTYDANGNMITDQNKGITSAIQYNFLNLPQTITKGNNTINYIYDATGRKLTQTVSFGTISQRTDYIGEMIYENDQLQFISHDEGRIVTAKTELVYTHAGGSAEGFTGVNASLTQVNQNGTEKYVKVTATSATARAGVSAIGGTFQVTPGERYKIRVKGYRDKGTAASSNPVYISVKTNGTDLNWPGAALPGIITTAPTASWQTESWVEQIVTIPATHTQLQVGVTWNTPVLANEVFYINEFEITKLTTKAPEYQYHIKDHLGNVRLTFTTSDETDQSLATMETANAAAEQSQFLYYDEAVKINSPLFNHTNDASSGGTVPVTEMDISPTTLILAVGQTGQLTKAVMPANATNQAVIWSSSNPEVATVNTSTGAVTGVAVGTATITVTSSGSPSVSASSTVTVGGGSSSDTQSPTAPSNLVSPTKTETSVSLTWTASTDNVGVTGYEIYNNGTLLQFISPSTSYTVTGLTANTAYSFTLKAKDQAGNLSAASNTVNVTTNGASSPLHIEAESYNAMSGVAISSGVVESTDVSDWMRYDNVNLGSGYTTFAARYAKGAGSGNTVEIRLGSTTGTLIGTLTTSLTGGWGTFTTGTTSLTGASGIQTVYIVFPSGSGNGNFDWFEFQGSSGDVTPPTTPSNLASPTKTETSVSLTWTASTDNVGVTGYEIYNNGTLLQFISPATSYTVTGLTANTAYSFTLKAKDQAGNLSTASNMVNVTTNGASSPLHIEAESYNAMSGVSISAGIVGSTDVSDWMRYDNVNLGSGYTTFAARYAKGAGSGNTVEIRLGSTTGTLIGTLTTALTGGWGTFTTGTTSLTGASGIQTVYIVFPSGSGNGNFDWFEFQGGSSSDVTPPTTPSNLASPTKTDMSVSLTWTASTDNVGVTGYEIYNNGTLLQFISAVTSYTVTELTANTAYSFTLKAKDQAGNLSAASNTVNVTTNGASPPLHIEAESYNAMSGVAISSGVVESTDASDWMRYDNVNLGSGYTTFAARYAKGAGSGNTVEIRLGSTTGTLIGTLTTSLTGGWGTFTTGTTSLTGASGIQTVYIVFPSGSGNGNFDWFEFQGSAGGNSAVTDLTLSTTTVTLVSGQTSQLTKTISPSNADNQNVGWISSNTAVATVSNSGLVTAVSTGTATITCTSIDGGFNDETTVTVNGSGATTFYSTRLAGTENERYGLAKSLSVMPGDIITTEVFVKYLDTNTNNWTTALNNLITSIANGTAPAGTLVDGGAPGSIGGGTLPITPIDHSGEGGSEPKAYLNYIVFGKDNSSTPLNFGFKRISTIAIESGQDAPHQRLAFDGSEQIEITEPGYVYIYISNENGTPVEVYFDDFKVTHVKSPIVQSNDYYPFGMAFNSYQRENSTPNKYKFGGKEEQTELALNTIDWGWRQYDPAIGRWNVIDQWAEKYNTTSPYAFVQNNPILNREIDGRYFDEKNEKRAAKIERKAEKRADKLEAKAAKLEARGGDSGDRRARVAELRQSGRDIRDMRNDADTEYRYARATDGKPATTPTSDDGNVVTMYHGGTMGSKIHESRHGGQVARGEQSFQRNAEGAWVPGNLYGVSDEISAYRAEYSYAGKIKYEAYFPVANDAHLFQIMQGVGQRGVRRQINNINQIDRAMVNSMAEGPIGAQDHIYPKQFVNPQEWNSN